MKCIAKIRYGLGQPPRLLDGGLPFIRATNVDGGRILTRRLLRVDPYDVPVGRNAIVRSGEVVVVRSGAYTGDSAIVPSWLDGSVIGYDMVVSAFGAEPGYVAMSMLAPYILDDQLIPSSLRAAQPHLNAVELGTAICFLPTREEQQVITLFLGHADRHIQQLIRVKRRAIALLNEQKQAIIHRAVTQGLDPSVRRKDSGVPWLGEVPEHWEIRPLKRLTQFKNGFPFKPSDWGTEGVPIVRIQNLNGSESFNRTLRADVPESLLLNPGDLLFAWSGNRGTSFGSFIWNRPYTAYLNQHIFKLHGYALPTNFFYYLLRAVTAHVEEQAGGIIGLVHVTKPELGSVMVPLPPLVEQVAIAEFLEQSTRKADRVIAAAEREISLLREFRERLIADVVTGQVDVREAAARLPPLPEDEGPADLADADGPDDPDDADAEPNPDDA